MSETRNFFACSVCQPGEDYCEDNLKRITTNSAFILHENTSQKGAYYDIKEGDILLLKYNNSFIAYGEALERKKTSDANWNLWATVKEWNFNNPNNKTQGIAAYGIGENTIGGGMYGTVKKLNNFFGLGKAKEIDPNTSLYKTLKGEVAKNKADKKMQNLIDLLHYKHQIILQGPPGTGKTRLAIEVAEELTKAKTLGSPLHKIDEFFKKFDASNPEVIKRRTEADQLLAGFKNRFPKEKVKDLTLAEYAIGTGSNDSFCWWLERGLKSLGYYFPGSARSYLIFWKKDINDYSKHTSLVKDIDDNEEAMQLVASTIAEFVATKDFYKARKYFGDGLLLKILHSYYPDEFAPINSEQCMNNVLKLMGVDFAKMNPLEKNLKIQDLYLQKKEEFDADVTNLEFMHFLFSSFDLFGNLTIQTDQVITEGEYKIVQFHPAYSYEDFIRGITAVTNNNVITYRVENRILAEFADKALRSPSSKYILIIDEINRANLAAVLGEMIYALEYRYDRNNPSRTTVESMYALNSDGDSNESKQITLPKNLYIIGTMNTADRSVGHIDYAIRRRFAFVDVPPSEAVIEEVVLDSALNTKAKSLFNSVCELFSPSYLASDFQAKDVQLGHSYFLADSENKLRLKLEYEIKPLLREYLRDGVLLDAAKEKIEKLDV